MYLNSIINHKYLKNYFEQIPGFVLELCVRILIALLVLFVGTKIIKLIRKIIKKALTRAGADVGVIQFTDSFVRVGLLALLIFTIASNFGVDATSIIAVIGSAGVAIGLALQGSLSNLAGGVLILVLKPFKVGDYIKEDTNKNEGVVSEISMFYTKLTTYDGSVIVLPNGTLANTSLTNVTGTFKRKIEVCFSVSYDTDIDLVRSVLTEMLEKEETVLQEDDKQIFVSQFGESGISMVLKCYTKNDDFWITKCKLMEDTKKTLDKAGIVMPFPQMEVKVKS